MTNPLDRPIWSALTGPQAHLAVVHGGVRRYPEDISIFGALDPDVADPWSDVITLGGTIGLIVDEVPCRPGLSVLFREEVHQLVCESEPDGPGAVDPIALTESDWPAMGALVEATQPGPWAPRTPMLGTYLGVRHGDALVAMAGERMRPEGATEISAVCTAPEVRGLGLAASLTATLVRQIQARGETAFLHVAASNPGARRVYERLGFRYRTTRIAHGILATDV